MIEQALDIFLHVDEHLAQFCQDYGSGWVYGLLFAIVFIETGLVVMPFLPGDSLLFAAGALAASPEKPISIVPAAMVLFAAAVLGDAVNYHIGKFVGPRVFRMDANADLSGLPLWKRLLFKGLSRKHLDRANAFYEKHGGKAVVLARFVPIVRTFIPFVAGAGAMRYARFVWFNILGAALWVAICVGAGYLFGNVPIVKKNFEIAIIVIIFLSILPIVFEFVRARREAARVPTPAVEIKP